MGKTGGDEARRRYQILTSFDVLRALSCGWRRVAAVERRAGERQFGKWKGPAGAWGCTAVWLSEAILEGMEWRIF